MVSFIDFPIFYGVSGDLRPWISWLEEFFVRERFTAEEKMNLAQSLLEGEANAWFYSSRKRFAFQSWEHLVVELLIWRFGDFGDGGVFSDLELFLFWNKYDQILRKQRRKRMETTSLNLQESISSMSTIKEKITVGKSSNQQKIIEEFSENVADILEEKKLIPQCQVPNSSLEPSLSFSSEPLDVSASWPCAIVSTNPVHSQSGFASVKNMNNAHHVFDELSPRRHKFQQRRKPSLSPKSRMFKFKHRTLLSNWSQKDLHQVIDISEVNNMSPCFSANFGLVRQKQTFQCLRLTKLAHKSKALYHLRMLHDPGGTDDEHSVDINYSQLSDEHKASACVVVKCYETATYAPAMQTEGCDDTCAAARDALESTGTCIVTSLTARCDWLVFDRGKYGQIQWPEIQEMVAAPVSLQLILDDLKSHMRHKWKSKHLQAVFALQNNPQRFADGGIYVQLQLNGYKTQIGDCLICGDVTSALELYLSSVFSTVTSANSGWLQGLLEQVLEGDDKAYTKIFDKLQLQLPQGMDLQEYADGLTKNFELEAALKDRTADVYKGVAHEYMVQQLLDLLMIGDNPITCSKFGHTTNMQLIVVRMLYSWGICILFTNSWERKFCKDWWFKFKYNIRIGEALRLWNHLIGLFLHML